jgi:hypothetical protein
MALSFFGRTIFPASGSKQKRKPENWNIRFQVFGPAVSVDGGSHFILLE